MKTLDAQNNAKKLSWSMADTDSNDTIKGKAGDDVLSARNGNDRLRGHRGDDLLISYSDSGEPAVLGKQVVNANEPLANSNDILSGGAGADTFMWAIEIDAKPKFLQKHTQADGRINGANNALAGENNNSHDHWIEGIGDDVIADLNLEEGDKIVINGHTVENYEIEQKGGSYILHLRSNQGNADQNNPNGAHDGDAIGTIKLRGAANRYSEDQIKGAISLDKMVNYVADGRGIETVNPDTTANQSAIADGAMRVQAEDMMLSGAYKVEALDSASGQQIISLKGGPNDEMGSASFKFNKPGGKYDIRIGYYDENDGVGKLELNKGDRSIASFELDEQLDDRIGSRKTFTTRTISGVDVKRGEIFSLTGYEDGIPSTAEHARVDYIEFVPSDGSVVTPLPTEPDSPMPTVPKKLPSVAKNMADTSGNDKLRGSSADDVISARNGNDKLAGRDGNDLLISYSDEGEPAVLGKQVVNQNEPLSASRDVMTGGNGADTFMWALELDAKEKFLKKHTQADGRIDGANNALAGENDASHNHWAESIGKDVVTDFSLEEGDKIVIKGHTVENYKIEEKGNNVLLHLRSNQGNADQSNPNGAHDGDLLGTIKLRGAAKYSEADIRKAISVDKMVNYVAEGRGLEVVDADTTANQKGTAMGGFRIPAEAMDLMGDYKIEASKAASGGELISLKGGPEDTGMASFKFEGARGKYQMKVAYFDENDGVGKLELLQDETLLGDVSMDQKLNDGFASADTLSSYMVSDVMAKTGDIFSIKGYEQGGEHARVDYVEFVPMGIGDSSADDAIRPDAMKPDVMKTMGLDVAPVGMPAEGAMYMVG
ncbi:MAG: hypothetical protein AAFN12_07985 [Cyanobacteria bacterium J06560_2]